MVYWSDMGSALAVKSVGLAVSCWLDLSHFCLYLSLEGGKDNGHLGYALLGSSLECQHQANR